MTSSDPIQHKCACGEPARGSVGSTVDPTYILWVCAKCYTRLDMKPLGTQKAIELTRQLGNRD